MEATLFAYSLLFRNAWFWNKKFSNSSDFQQNFYNVSILNWKSSKMSELDRRNWFQKIRFWITSKLSLNRNGKIQIYFSKLLQCVRFWTKSFTMFQISKKNWKRVRSWKKLQSTKPVFKSFAWSKWQLLHFPCFFDKQILKTRKLTTRRDLKEIYTTRQILN